MNWAEARRRGQDDQVDVRIDGLLVSVEADELAIVRHVDAISLFVLQRRQAAFEPVAKGVGHGHQLDVAGGGQGLIGGAGSAAAAADQRDLDLVVTGRMSAAGDR